MIYDFDPKSITTSKQKEHYETGYKQGRKWAERDTKGFAKDASKEQLLASTKALMTDRDIAVCAAVDQGGATSIVPWRPSAAATA